MFLSIFVKFSFCVCIPPGTDNDDIKLQIPFSVFETKTKRHVNARVRTHTAENQNSNYFNSFGYNSNSTHSNNNHAATVNTQWSVWQQFPWPYIQPEQNRWSKCCCFFGHAQHRAHTRTHIHVCVCRFVSTMCR